MLSTRGNDAILSKWVIVNTLWTSLVAAAWHQGWISYIFEKDITYISHGIAVSFLLVLAVSAYRAVQLRNFFRISDSIREAYLKASNREGSDRSESRDALKTELISNASFIDFFATAALAVGVMGTVVGLIFGFSHVNPEDISNAANAGAVVGGLLKGLSVAFHTTLVGGVVNLWLRTNHYILMQGNAYLYSKVLGG